jgi:hypothetical protein
LLDLKGHRTFFYALLKCAKLEFFSKEISEKSGVNLLDPQASLAFDSANPYFFILPSSFPLG